MVENDVEIYVKSRGVSKGYSWLNEQQQEVPVPDSVNDNIQLVDSSEFSIILYRDRSRLFLLITGLDSSKRTDSQTRKIRNSVLWIGKESEESRLRAIAIQALRGKLENKVDKAVSSIQNAPGFKIDFHKLSLAQLVGEDRLPKNDPHLTARIGNLSKLKANLIEELENYSLPKNEGMLLIVVSSTVSQSNLDRCNVWRGLSDAIDPDEDWIETAGLKPEKSSFLENLNSINPFSDSKKNKLIKLISVFILSLFVGICISFVWYSVLDKDRQNEVERLKSEIIQLNNSRSELKAEIKIQKQKAEAYQKFEDKSNELYSEFQKDAENSYLEIQEKLKRDYNTFKSKAQDSRKLLQNELQNLNQKMSHE